MLLHGHIGGIRSTDRSRQRRWTVWRKTLHLWLPDAVRLARSESHWTSLIWNREIGAALAAAQQADPSTSPWHYVKSESILGGWLKLKRTKRDNQWEPEKKKKKTKKALKSENQFGNLLRQSGGYRELYTVLSPSNLAQETLEVGSPSDTNVVLVVVLGVVVIRFSKY